MSAVEDQREFTRVKVAIHVELRMGGNVVIRGELDNVSFNGVLLRCEATLPEQTPCLVFLHLDGGQGGRRHQINPAKRNHLCQVLSNFHLPGLFSFPTKKVAPDDIPRQLSHSFVFVNSRTPWLPIDLFSHPV